MMFFASAARAEVPKEMFSARCQVDTFRFALSATSPSGSDAEQDMTLWLVHGGGRLQINTTPGGFLQTHTQKSLCSSVAAFRLGHRVVLVLGVDGRPHCNTLALIQYDPKRRKLLSFETSTGTKSCQQPIEIVPVKDGFKYRAVFSYVEDAVGKEAWRIFRDERGAWVQSWGDVLTKSE